MNIERIEVRRYRSLYDVALTPGPLTVLVGPNNSGKTNIMEALSFLSEVYEFDLETAISRNGGFENVAHRKKRRTKLPVEFAIEATADVEDLRSRLGIRPSFPEQYRSGKVTFRHEFGFAATGTTIEADFFVENEELAVLVATDSESLELFRLRRNGNDTVSVVTALGEASSVEELRADPLWRLVQPLNDPEFSAFLQERIRNDQLMISTAVYNILVDLFINELAKVSLYQLSPLEVRRSGVPTPNATIGRHGDNLPALVAQMRRHSTRQWKAVLSAMQRVVPSLRDIRTDFTPDRRLTLQFVEEGAGRPWGVEEVSDGTMQSLALFMTVLDPRLPVLMLEEPENSVHPWIIRVFIDLCREASDKQIIVTTHSPALLDYISPSEIWIVWRQGGSTSASRVTDLDEDLEELWADGTIGLAEYVLSGAVDQAVPSS